ncbi:AraC family transcriptional regulator [Nocardia sp. NPDC004582]
MANVSTGAFLERSRGLRTEDIDEFRAEISKRLTSHRLSPTAARSRIRARLAEAELGPLTLVYAEHAGAELVADFTDRLSYYDINLSVGGSNRLRCDGVDLVVDPGHAALLSPTMAARMHLSDAYRQLHIRIERPVLERHLEGLLGQPIAGPIRFRPDMPLLGAAASWSETVLTLARDLGRADSLAGHPLAAAQWTDFLMTGLLTCQSHDYSEQLGAEHAPYRRRSVSRAVDFIHDHLDQPLSLSGVAAAAGVSARSLQRDFQDCYGLSPTAYIQQTRLSRVHDELRTATPGAGTTVTETALRWGFTHGPRFAEAYRRHYGVAPSVTLRQALGL